MGGTSPEGAAHGRSFYCVVIFHKYLCVQNSNFYIITQQARNQAAGMISLMVWFKKTVSIYGSSVLL